MDTNVITEFKGSNKIDSLSNSLKNSDSTIMDSLPLKLTPESFAVNIDFGSSDNSKPTATPIEKASGGENFESENNAIGKFTQNGILSDKLTPIENPAQKSTSTQILAEKSKSAEFLAENFSSIQNHAENFTSKKILTGKSMPIENPAQRSTAAEFLIEKSKSTEIFSKKSLSTEIPAENSKSIEIAEKSTSTEILAQKSTTSEILAEKSIQIYNPSENSTPAEKVEKVITVEVNDEKSIPEKLDGEKTILENCDGEKAIPEKLDGEKVIPEKPDGENAIPEKPDDENAIPEKPDGENGIPEKPDGENAIPEKPDGVKAIPEKLDEKAIPEKLDGKNSILEKPDGENVIPEKPDGENAILEKPDDENAIPEKPDGENAIPEKPDGEKTIQDKSDGEQAISEKTDGENAIPEKPDGEKTIQDKPDGEKAISEKLDGEKAIPEKLDEKAIPEKLDGEKTIPEKLDDEKTIPEKPDDEKTIPEKPDDENTIPEKPDGEKIIPEKLNGEKTIQDKPDGEKTIQYKPDGEKAISEKVTFQVITATSAEKKEINSISSFEKMEVVVHKGKIVIDDEMEWNSTSETSRSSTEDSTDIPNKKTNDATKDETIRSETGSDDEKESMGSIKFKTKVDDMVSSDNSNSCDVWSSENSSSTSDSSAKKNKEDSSDVPKVKYTVKTRYEGSRELRNIQSYANAGKEYKKHEFSFDALMDAVQDVAARGLKMGQAAQKRGVPYYRVYAFIKDMMADYCSEDEEFLLENENLNTTSSDSITSQEHSSTFPSWSTAPHFYRALHSQPSQMKVEMLGGVVETTSLTNKSKSPMINIPSGIVREFLAEPSITVDRVIKLNQKEPVSSALTVVNGVTTSTILKEETNDSNSIKSKLTNGTDRINSTEIKSDTNCTSFKELKKVGSTPPTSMETDITPSIPSSDAEIKSVNITNNAKNISDSIKNTIANGLKRKSDAADTKKIKKIKLSNEDESIPDVLKSEKRKLNKSEIDEEAKKIKLSGKLHKLSRSGLEELIVGLFMNKLLHSHQIGQYNTLCEKLEANLETSRKKTKQFHKELEDLRKVTKRLQDEHNARKQHLITPIKIKRSVGIQAAAHIIQKGLGMGSSNTTTTNNNINKNNSSSNNKIPQRQVLTSKLIAPRAANTNLIQVSHANTSVVSNTMQAGITNTGQMVLVNTSNVNGNRQFVPLQVQQTNKQLYSAIVQNKLQQQQKPVQQVNTTTNNNLGVIDLTDEEENSKVVPPVPKQISPTNMIKLNQPGGTTGYVTLAQPGSTQYVIVPNSSGSGAAAVMVANVATSSSLQNSTNTSSHARLVAISPSAAKSTSAVQQSVVHSSPLKNSHMLSHPAPLPRTAPQQVVGSAKQLPSTPTLKLSHKDNSIVLSWTMNKTPDCETIASYQLYAYQEGTAPPSPSLWKKVGSVKALELPMACTLTQFMPGHRYHFAVRAVDLKSRLGPFSEPRSINLEK